MTVTLNTIQEERLKDLGNYVCSCKGLAEKFYNPVTKNKCVVFIICSGCYQLKLIGIQDKNGKFKKIDYIK